MKRKRRPSKPRAIGEPVLAFDGPTPERIAKGSFMVETIHAHMTDSTGAPTQTRMVVGRRRRDMTADLHRMLCSALSPELEPEVANRSRALIAAAVMFEAAYDEAGGDLRVVANLNGMGGGPGDSMEHRIDSRDAFHKALEALRLGGQEVVDVVEAIVLRQATARAAGIRRYVRGRDQAVHAAACLTAGLSLLAAHYRIGETATRRAA